MKHTYFIEAEITLDPEDYPCCTPEDVLDSKLHDFEYLIKDVIKHK